MQDQDSATAEAWGQQDQRLHRFVARWTCWVLAAVVIIVDVIFMVQHWAGTIAVPPGAHGYMVVLVILLAGAGWAAGDERLRAAYAAGQATAVAGVRHILAEIGNRLAVIEADVAYVRARPLLTEERMAEIFRAELEPLQRQVADLEREIAENRILMREIQATTGGKVNGVVTALPRSRHAGGD